MLLRTVAKAACVAIPLTLALGCAQPEPRALEVLHDELRPSVEVDPFIGTDRDGNNFPGATTPFGMVQLSPDTTTAAGGYRYGHDRIRGFSFTHYAGAGCSAFQDVPFAPTLAAPVASPLVDPEAYASGFDHGGESASAGAYQVLLEGGIGVELTATTRTGALRVAFPAGAPGYLVVNPSSTATGVKPSHVELVGDRALRGYADGGTFCDRKNRYRVYFHAELDRPFDASGTWTAEDGAGDAPTGHAAWIRVPAGAPVVVKVGLSYVSEAQAAANLAAEAAGRPFDTLRTAAATAWDAALGRVAVTGGTRTERTIFYTALYRALSHPNVASDVDGSYRGFDGAVHSAGGRTHYASFSGWDIYRTQIPLVALLFPDEASDMMASLVASADQCGAIPKWSSASDETGVMEGGPGDLIVAGAYAFGARDFDARRALAHMVETARTPGDRCNQYAMRRKLERYLAHGFIPEDDDKEIWGPTSTTLEYVLADFAISRLAAALGEGAIADEFLTRAGWWRNLYNPATGYLQPRYEDGFHADFTPTAGAQVWYVEGDGAQYTWFAPHDLGGLFAKMGGPAAVVARLDAFFAEIEPLQVYEEAIASPFVYMGNEPSFATPWAYDWAGAPWKTQEVVRRVMTTLFRATPTGLEHNDDLGTMSAWYVWAALGMYPAIPPVGGVALAGPLFPEVVLHLPGGDVRIRARGARAGAPYVQALMVDGVAWTRPWLPIDALLGGADLRFEMGAAPNRAWGARPEDAPPSFPPPPR